MLSGQGDGCVPGAAELLQTDAALFLLPRPTCEYLGLRMPGWGYAPRSPPSPRLRSYREEDTHKPEIFRTYGAKADCVPQRTK